MYKIVVGLQEISSDHPFYSLKGTDLYGGHLFWSISDKPINNWQGRSRAIDYTASGVFWLMCAHSVIHGISYNETFNNGEFNMRFFDTLALAIEGLWWSYRTTKWAQSVEWIYRKWRNILDPAKNVCTAAMEEMRKEFGCKWLYSV
jgi:hypothetical protein